MKAVDRLNLALLALALVLAGLLLRREAATPVVSLPLLDAGAPPGALQGPGEAEAALHAKALLMGELYTVEDLARGALLLQQGQLEGVPPLSDSERAELAEALREADADRTELLALEQQIRSTEAEMGEIGLQLAATLSPEQRAWVVAQRDRVSVGEVERAYWDAVLAAVEAP